MMLVIAKPPGILLATTFLIRSFISLPDVLPENLDDSAFCDNSPAPTGTPPLISFCRSPRISFCTACRRIASPRPCFLSPYSSLFTS
jgi:hypothetical protein